MEDRPETTTRRRRRSASVTLGLGAVLAAALTGCSASADEYDYGALCADRQTEQRVNDDEDCDDGFSYAWYFVAVGGVAPAVGERLSGGSLDPPASDVAVCYGGIPAEGGEVTRGGFGACSGAVGG